MKTVVLLVFNYRPQRLSYITHIGGINNNNILTINIPSCGLSRKTILDNDNDDEQSKNICNDMDRIECHPSIR